MCRGKIVCTLERTRFESSVAIRAYVVTNVAPLFYID